MKNLGELRNILIYSLNTFAPFRFAPVICLLLLTVMPGAGVSEPLTTLKQVQMENGLFGRSLSFRLYLSGSVPHRVFLTEGADRLIVELKGTKATSVQARHLASQSAGTPEFSSADPDWLRISVELLQSFMVSEVELTDTAQGAVLSILLTPVTPELSLEYSGKPPVAFPVERRGSDSKGLKVVIDAGHGGSDPGAGRSGVQEKDVVLYFANVLKRVLSEMPGVHVIMTRTGDEFVRLSERVRIAENSGADIFLSVHANAVEDPGLSGAIVFTRSESASNAAARARARFENQSGDVSISHDVNGPRVEHILGALADRRARSRSLSLARHIVPALRPDASQSTQTPHQAADFQVLSARNIASLLLELGFLSNPDDFNRLNSAAWHDKLAVSLAAAIVDWNELQTAGGR